MTKLHIKKYPEEDKDLFTRKDEAMKLHITKRPEEEDEPVEVSAEELLKPMPEGDEDEFEKELKGFISEAIRTSVREELTKIAGELSQRWETGFQKMLTEVMKEVAKTTPPTPPTSAPQQQPTPAPTQSVQQQSAKPQQPREGA